VAVTDPTPKPQILTSADQTSTADAIADQFVNRLIGCDHAHISVTGGGLGSAIWPKIAAHPEVGDVPWNRIHIWFSDERFVPAGDVDRNDTAVIPVAGELGIPPENVHSVPGPELVPTVDAAAYAYALHLGAKQTHRSECVAAPVFAVSILGIGPDGHVASLFPGRPELTVTQKTVVPVNDSPKPPPQRVSFTRPTLMQCEELWMIAAGAEKASAVARAITGGDPSRTPASNLHGRRATLWFVDAAAAAKLPKDD